MTPFQQAFADARAAGKKEFEFGGKPYHTRMKNEKAGTKTTVSAERTAPPSRTAKATVSQTVRPAAPTGAGVIPTKTTKGITVVTGTPVRRGGADTRVKAAVVAKPTSPKATTMAALKANRKDFSRAGVEAKKMATMTGPKVARKK